MKTWPPRRYEVSTYVIPFDYYHAQGMQGVIFDIDNTLVPHDAPADERAKNLFSHLRALGMDTCLLSNNKEPRVAAFAEAVGGSNYIYKGGKPGVKNYKKAMELMGTSLNSTIFVGDQLFTDVYGAKRTGIRSFLVKPINPKEEIQIVLKRYPEALILFFYRRDKKRRQYDKRKK